MRRAELCHLPRVLQVPPLSGSLHPDLQDVAMSAFGRSPSDGEAALPEEPIAHPLLVASVVADQVVERFERVGLVWATA